jgi:hypothetical protein
MVAMWAGASLCAGAHFLQADAGFPAHAADPPHRFRTRRRDGRRRADAFLVLVAARLRGVEMIGDGVVARVCKEAQREFWDAPDLSRSRDVSKWR